MYGRLGKYAFALIHVIAEFGLKWSGLQKKKKKKICMRYPVYTYLSRHRQAPAQVLIASPLPARNDGRPIPNDYLAYRCCLDTMNSLAMCTCSRVARRAWFIEPCASPCTGRGQSSHACPCMGPAGSCFTSALPNLNIAQRSNSTHFYICSSGMRCLGWICLTVYECSNLRHLQIPYLGWWNHTGTCILCLRQDVFISRLMDS